MNNVKYKFYATLLDSFQGYLNSSEIYQKYWGFSENPAKTEEEFELEQYQGLIDRINRVPFDSEAADKGTAFNEVIDCIIDNVKSEKMEIEKSTYRGKSVIKATYNERTFNFDTELCKQFASLLQGSLTQQYTEGVLQTKYGDVLVYGYIDQIMPFKVVDTKTTGKYSVFKFRNNWQHKVYPYCLKQNGVDINEFEYLVTDFRNIYTETYTFTQKDVQALVLHCEQFIEFIEAHKHLITDEKIFALK